VDPSPFDQKCSSVSIPLHCTRKESSNIWHQTLNRRKHCPKHLIGPRLSENRAFSSFIECLTPHFHWYLFPKHNHIYRPKEPRSWSHRCRHLFPGNFSRFEGVLWENWWSTMMKQRLQVRILVGKLCTSFRWLCIYVSLFGHFRLIFLLLDPTPLL